MMTVVVDDDDDNDDDDNNNNVTACGSLPDYRHHYQKGFRCHHFGQYYDILILYNIFYNSITLYIKYNTKEIQYPFKVYSTIQGTSLTREFQFHIKELS